MSMEPTRAWRVAWMVLCLLAVFVPLAYLIALSDVRVAPLGTALDRTRLALRARPAGPDWDTGLGRGDRIHRAPAIVDASARSASGPDPSHDAAPAGNGPEVLSPRPLRPDVARSPPTA